MRIDDKESGQGRDLIFLHLHLTGFNNTVNFFQRVRGLKGTVPGKHEQRANLSPHPLHLQGYFTAGDLSVIVYMRNAYAVHRPLKHAASYRAIEKEATEVKREYGFCAHVHGK